MVASFQAGFRMGEALEFIDCAAETFLAIDYIVFHTKETNNNNS